MAKKKVSTAQEEDSMVSKLEIKKSNEEQDRVSRIVGTIFIVLGICFVVYGLISFIRNRQSYVLDSSLEAPSIASTPEYTNNDKVTISGVANGYDKVEIYIDGKKVGTADVNEDGTFSYDYYHNMESGSFVVSSAGIKGKGFEKKYITPESVGRTVTVDKQAPEEASNINYPVETSGSKTNITGNAEPGSTVTLKGTDGFISTITDSNGNFLFSDINLTEGENTYALEVMDRAGNKAVSSKEIVIIYSPYADINGDGIADTVLPVAAGNLDYAWMEITSNNLMLTFGIVALACLIVSSITVKIRNKREI